MVTMPRTLVSCALLAAALAAAPALFGQSARWEPEGGSLPVNTVTQLQLVFDDVSPDDVPTVPRVDGLVINYQGQSSNMSLINGTFTRNVTLTFAVLLQVQHDVVIPAFDVKTGKGPVRVPSVHFTPSGATVGSSGVSLSDAASAKLEPASDEVWAGEVFDLKYSVQAASGYGPTWGNTSFEWDPAPLVIEDWSQPEPFKLNDNGPRTGLSYHTRAMAPAAGHIRLNPTSQLLSLSVGVAGFGFFQQRQYQQFAVPDSPVAIDVRPLPPAPAGFMGAVGSFKIESKVVPRQVNAGEPVTWTVVLSGSGNWPQIRGLPSREAPADFQVIQPKPKRTQPPGKVFEGSISEDIVLIPTTAGTYDLPPLAFTYFDPAAGSYATITAPGGTIKVDPSGPAAGPQSANPVGVAPGAPKISLSNPGTEAKPPELPTQGLGDPLPKSDSAPRPLRLRTVAVACAVPFVVLALFWAVLAYRRARATDPLRLRREARLRLRSTLHELRSASSAGAVPLLLAWQRDSGVLWDLAHAAPPPSSLPDAEWSSLWTEADRCLYSTDGVLSADWTARAQAALEEKSLRAFSLGRVLLPRNLLPFLFLALAAAACPRMGADEPSDAYRGGRFATASNLWAGRLGSDPLDWSARYNLSLALAQQDRWAESAAHASAAFVQDPGDPATRRQLALACDKAGFIPEPLDVLLQRGPLPDLARLGSPGAWQRTGAASAAALAVAFGILLAGAYGVAALRWARPTGLAILVLSALSLAASFVAYRAYGMTADTRAVVIWRTGTLRSVPTEADVSQKTIPLPAGSIAVADKDFLEWVRLSFPNGQTGWVPRAEAVYLWRSPAN
ncbi:MAG TPA: BatD family protein [Opitutaceae bacterium]